MAKSKHPPLFKKALKHIAEFNTDRKKDANTLKTYASACKATAKLADTTVSNAQSIYDKMADIMDKYTRKVVEIETVEDEIKAARGDRAKLAELNKKAAKLEREADKLRSDYEAQGQQMIAAFVAMKGAITATHDITTKLTHWG